MSKSTLNIRKPTIVAEILKGRLQAQPERDKGLAFAPTNIALCKYWGKRDIELNLPITSSLSITLPDKGAMTTIIPYDGTRDIVTLNGTELQQESTFVQRIVNYLNLFRNANSFKLHVNIKMNIPVGAGLASSACGFASLISALNDLFDWKLKFRELSILARLGSGSAARSFWNGFVEWHAGVSPDGMDSYAQPLDIEWSSLNVGILMIDHAQKFLSSTEAMQRTVDTSVLYQSWPKKVSQDLNLQKHAILSKNFKLLAGVSESNALAMHATMLSSWPPICYFLPDTLRMIHKIWELRKNGLDVYFTEDAGPNLKLLFLEKDKLEVEGEFKNIETIRPFI